MFRESISPTQPTRSYKLQTDMYDTQTGENRWSARKTCTIAGFGDGEKYLHTLIDSLFVGSDVVNKLSYISMLGKLNV